MAIQKAKRIYRDFTPDEKDRWQKAVAETEAEKHRLLEMGRLIRDIGQQGFALVPQILSPDQQTEIVDALGPVSGAGRRRMLSIPAVYDFAYSPALLGLVRPCFKSEPVPMRAIYFDKSPSANWLVPWHQDLTIAVKERVDLPGFGPWSFKEGIPHVQPPVEFLEQMIAVRLHLDDADETNGALRVLPATHTMGRLSDKQIQDLRSRTDEHLCRASAGDALLMRPLLLHASGRSTSGQSRRVLHVEYAGFELPAPLAWHTGA